LKVAPWWRIVGRSQAHDTDFTRVAMIITDSEVDELEELLDRVGMYYMFGDEVIDSPEDASYLSLRPHLLMPLGFDEYKALNARADPAAAAKALVSFGILGLPRMEEYESLYREGQSGRWLWLDGIRPRDDGHDAVMFVGNGDSRLEISVSRWLSVLRDCVQRPEEQSRTLWLPSLWTPSMQLSQTKHLAEAVPDILQAVHSEQRALRDVHWRQLEEIVAELLAARGLEIFLTPPSGDGGRDIVARGELVPGEPTTIAIEVKQKDVVSLGDVRAALQANAEFPCLMIATAGRFSAGVTQERRREGNRLRLFLKDGVALAQWIDAYGLRKGWTG
jgi:hypothetical protein